MSNSPSRGAVATGFRWGLFDFANSAYYLVYIVLLYPLFLKENAGPEQQHFEAWWGAAQGVAVAVSVTTIAVLSRFIDRVRSDRFWQWVPKVFLVPALVSLVLPLLAATHQPFLVQLVAFSVVHAIYLASLTFYDSSLVDLSRGHKRIEISGWAWGFGYLGGVACLVLIKGAEALGADQAIGMLIGSLFFAGLAWIAARAVRKLPVSFDPAQEEAEPGKEHDLGTGKPGLGALAILLAVMVLVVDGIAVFLSFMVLYWKSLGLPEGRIAILMLVIQCIAFPATGLLTRLARFSVKTLLLTCGLLWLVATGLALMSSSFQGALAAALVVSLVVGTSQALLRAIFAEVAPTDRRLFSFSLFSIVEKGAAFAGPVVAGIAITFVGFRPVLLFAGICVFTGSIGLATVLHRCFRSSRGSNFA
jgi:MFS transporter, UMF1 family